ncbi:MAG: hypothetical protein U0Q12_03410 [Vicinamibacterales bacterium]
MVAAIEQFDARYQLRMAAVERLCQPDEGREDLDRAPGRRRERAEGLVRLPGRRAAVARDERDYLDLLGLEAAQVAVACTQVMNADGVPCS